MHIVALELELHAPWIHSLKEKRSETKRLIAQLSHHFNVSVAETDALDRHATIVLGMAGIVTGSAQADRLSEQLTGLVAGLTDAEIVHIHKEMR